MFTTNVTCGQCANPTCGGTGHTPPCCAYALLIPAGQAHGCESTVTASVGSSSLYLVAGPRIVAETSGPWAEVTMTVDAWNALPDHVRGIW